MIRRQQNRASLYVRDNQWRNYQSTLRKKEIQRRAVRRLPFYGLALVVLVIMTQGIFLLLDNSLIVPAADDNRTRIRQVETFDTAWLQAIFCRLSPWNGTDNRFSYTTAGETYHVQSSLDPSLQEFIRNQIDRKNSRHFGLVAMEPDTGRILSMVSFDRAGSDTNICTLPAYPAASLFKIITAAAAIEKCGFNCATPVTFNDNKYTLYKIQLKDRTNKYTNRITFAESFADSVNPVFGKLGQNRLGKSVLETYAEAFGFNHRFEFEIPLAPSTISLAEDPYQWAEIASGFNRQTLISPMHGALMLAAIVNNGVLAEPTFIDEISKDQQVLYRRHSRTASDVIAPDTAVTLKKLMQQTVKTGTAAKSFSRFEKDAVLSRLYIGGKTGSINNNAKRQKYDWFAGYAEEKNGPGKIVVSVLVVHQDYIGTRAAHYSKITIKEYFKNYYASRNHNPAQASDTITETAAAL